MNFDGIEIDVLSQKSIDDAKTRRPGEGVGPAVTVELSDMIVGGKITTVRTLPQEYTNLGRLFNLPV